MNVRPLKLDDIEHFKIEESLKGALRAYVEQSGDVLARLGEVDGKPIFAAGIRPFWDGVGEAWIQVFDSSHAIGIIRAVQELLNYMVQTFHFHRVQATVRADDHRTLKFDQYIGFEIECRLSELYSDKCDAVILRYKK